MKTVRRLYWELGFEKFFFDLRERIRPSVQYLSEIRFGFYTGVIFGLILSDMLACFVFWYLVPDLELLSFLFDSFSTVLGWACVFFVVVSLISHLIRRYYGWSRSCSGFGGSK